MNLLRRAVQLPIFRNRVPSLNALLAPGQLKYLGAWYRSRRKDYLLQHGIPWITYDAARFLQVALKGKPALKVFEYGSGASTVYWAKLGAECFSIEHDPGWIEKIYAQLATMPEKGVITLQHLPPDPLPEGSTSALEHDLSDPDAYWTDWEAFRPYTFRAYAGAIDAFPDRYFDVVLVDGQARPSCLKHAAPKVRPGGYLILDDAEVPRYLTQAGIYLSHYDLHSFSGLAPIDGALSQTNIYIRRE